MLTSSGPSHATFCGWYFNWKLLASSGDPNVSSLTPEADNIWVSDGDTEAFDAEGTDTRAVNFETTDTEFNVPDNFDNNIEYMEKLISDSDTTVNIYIETNNVDTDKTNCWYSSSFFSDFICLVIYLFD